MKDAEGSDAVRPVHRLLLVEESTCESEVRKALAHEVVGTKQRLSQKRRNAVSRSPPTQQHWWRPPGLGHYRGEIQHASVGRLVRDSRGGPATVGVPGVFLQRLAYPVRPRAVQVIKLHCHHHPSDLRWDVLRG